VLRGMPAPAKMPPAPERCAVPAMLVCTIREETPPPREASAAANPSRLLQPAALACRAPRPPAVSGTNTRPELRGINGLPTWRGMRSCRVATHGVYMVCMFARPPGPDSAMPAPSNVRLLKRCRVTVLVQRNRMHRVLPALVRQPCRHKIASPKKSLLHGIRR